MPATGLRKVLYELSPLIFITTLRFNVYYVCPFYRWWHWDSERVYNHSRQESHSSAKERFMSIWFRAHTCKLLVTYALFPETGWCPNRKGIEAVGHQRERMGKQEVPENQRKDTVKESFQTLMTGCPHLMGLPISAWLLVVGGTQTHPTWWHREQRRLEEEKEDPLIHSSSFSDIKELFLHTYKGESVPLSWWKILLNSIVDEFRIGQTPTYFSQAPTSPWVYPLSWVSSSVVGHLSINPICE